MNSVLFLKIASFKNTEASTSTRKPTQTQADMRDRKQERFPVVAFKFLKSLIRKKTHLLSILGR